MRYSPDSEGYFSGQNGYGYKSIEDFVLGSIELSKIEDSEQKSKFISEKLDNRLATISTTVYQTAILNAGRMSLDTKKPVQIIYDENNVPIKIQTLY